MKLITLSVLVTAVASAALPVQPDQPQPDVDATSIRKGPVNPGQSAVKNFFKGGGGPQAPPGAGSKRTVSAAYGPPTDPGFTGPHDKRSLVSPGYYEGPPGVGPMPAARAPVKRHPVKCYPGMPTDPGCNVAEKRDLELRKDLSCHDDHECEGGLCYMGICIAPGNGPS